MTKKVFKIKTALFNDKIDRKSYLHAKSDHPESLKNVVCTVKCCVSKKLVQQTLNLNANKKYCSCSLLAKVMIHIRLKPKLTPKTTLNFLCYH